MTPEPEVYRCGVCRAVLGTDGDEVREHLSHAHPPTLPDRYAEGYAAGLRAAREVCLNARFNLDWGEQATLDYLVGKLDAALAAREKP